MNEYNEFLQIISLPAYEGLTEQQRKTLIGAAKAGDVKGAIKGLKKLKYRMRRKNNEHRKT